MRYAMIIAIALGLSGCGAWDRMKAHYGGGGTKVCVDGVTYLQFASGVSVAYSQDGKLQKCGFE